MRCSCWGLLAFCRRWALCLVLFLQLDARLVLVAGVTTGLSNGTSANATNTSAASSTTAAAGSGGSGASTTGAATVSTTGTTGSACIAEPAHDKSLSFPLFVTESLNFSSDNASYSSRVCEVEIPGERWFRFTMPEGTVECEFSANFSQNTASLVSVNICREGRLNPGESAAGFTCYGDILNLESARTWCFLVDSQGVVDQRTNTWYVSVLADTDSGSNFPATGVTVSGSVRISAAASSCPLPTTSGSSATSDSPSSASTSDATNGLGTGPVVTIFLGSVFGVAVLVGAAFGAFVYFRRGRAKVSVLDPDEQAFQTKQIQERDLSFGDRLAEGNFGEVWLGEWKGSPCVIKKLKDSGDEARAELIVEARQLAKLRSSPNICTFYGVCLDGELPCIVLELIPGGELKTLLYNHSKSISEHDLVEMANNLASGMEVLHDQNVLHLDLACRNFLVTGQHPLSLRICDFGLSQSLPEGQATVLVPPGAEFPVRWSDPAIWREGTFSKGCDVYSFGVCLWEMTERSVPWPRLMTNASVMEAVASGAILARPNPPESSAVSASTLYDLYIVMQECWAAKATRRPGFKDLRKRLGELRASSGGKEFELTELAAAPAPKNDQDSDDGDFEFYASHYAREVSNKSLGHVSEVIDGGYYSSATPRAGATEGGYATAIAPSAGSKESGYSTAINQVTDGGSAATIASSTVSTENGYSTAMSPAHRDRGREYSTTVSKQMS